MTFWLSATGAPALVVSFFFSVMSFSSRCLAAVSGFLGTDSSASSFAQRSQMPRTSTCVATTLPNPFTASGMRSALSSALSKSRANPQRTQT